MQMRRDKNSGLYTINSYENGAVVINKTPHHSSIIVSREKLITNWAPQTIEELTPEDFYIILALNPEVILLGTGNTLRFPETQILAPVYQKNVGIEVMNSSAASRTFNVLMAENRHAVAAIIV